MPKRVALDTGIFRELCHAKSEPEWFSTFVEMAKEGWSFHLTDVCFAEIIAARERSAITDVEGKKAVVMLEQILSAYFPCLPGNQKLFHLCGFRDKDCPVYDFDEDFEREYSVATWKGLKQLMASGEISEEVTFTVKGKVYKCPLKEGEAEAVLKEEREDWINAMAHKPVPDFDYEQCVQDIKSNFDEWAQTDGLPMSLRGDIIAHVQAEWEIRIASGYNPSSSKRKNDGIDFHLNFPFLLPALLLTTDKKFKNLLQGLKSYQANWVFLPKELAEKWEQQALIEPTWTTGDNE